MMKITKPLLAALLWSFAVAVTGAAAADAASAQPAAAQGTGYTEKGADTCLQCHGEAWPYPILPIFKSKHGQRADGRTPFAKLQCETCHGPGA